MMDVIAAAATVAIPAVGGVWYLSGRLSSIEQKVESMNAVVRRELTPNGGDSLRDRVVRIESQLHANRLNRFDEPRGTEF